MGNRLQPIGRLNQQENKIDCYQLAKQSYGKVWNQIIKLFRIISQEELDNLGEILKRHPEIVVVEDSAY